MSLIFLPALQSWCFFFGANIRTAQPIDLDGHPYFFSTRREAVSAAQGVGLSVDSQGKVSSRAGV